MKLYTVLYRNNSDEEWKIMKQFKDEMPAKTMEKSLEKQYQIKIIKVEKESKKLLTKQN